MAKETGDRFRKLQAEAQGAFDDTTMASREGQPASRLQSFVHFWVMVGRSFVRNRCPVRASALAYGSLLAMVPMLAVVISVSSSLLKQQGEQPIQQFIEKMVASVTPDTSVDPASGALEPSMVATDPASAGDGPAKSLTKDARFIETRDNVAKQINGWIKNVQSGTLGVTGMLALVFVAITMLARIEDTFNDIWGVTRGRSWFARIVQYWAAITLGPLLLALVLGLTGGSQLQATKEMLAQLPLGVGYLTSILFRFLPFVILSLAFGLFYQLMPNTKVHWRAALVGGAVGGTLWQINNLLNVLYVSQVVKNTKIYGSLGMVPVFMVGVYLSWMIMLFGAQVAYAYQNRRTYLQEKQAEGVNQRSREFVALRLMAHIGLRYQRGEKARTLSELSDIANVPTRLTGQVLQALVGANLLAESADGEAAYIPGRPMDRITAQDILQALRSGKGVALATREDAARVVVNEAFERIAEAERGVAGNLTLQALVDRLPAT